MSYSVFPQVFFIVAMCIGYVALNVRSRFNNESKKFANTCTILLVIYISILLYLAAGGRGNFNVRNLTLTPFSSYSFVLTTYNSFDVLEQIFQNILVFIPAGILIPETFGFRGKRYAVLLTVLSGAFLSFVIELAQFTYAIGYSETDDLINNTLGCVIGCGIFCFADKVSADSDGIRISKGWFSGLIPVSIVVTVMLGIVLYREYILYNL